MPSSQKYAQDRFELFECSLIEDVDCDAYDYVAATACGVVGGLIDIFLVSAPGDGKVLEKWNDKQVDNAVMVFSRLTGWKPADVESNDVAHAISYLEKNFKVNYDQRHKSDVGGLFDMNTRNHHMKSLAHSPSIVGLFFSLVNQFTSTASFADYGKLITIKTDLFDISLSPAVSEFCGHDVKSKLVCGTVNWMGHVMSDIAGSSVTRRQAGDGTGVPIPFFELFQFCNFPLGKDDARMSVAEIATQVFQQGYDARFGLALSVPTLVTDILSRIVWCLRRHFQYELPIKDCVPSSKHDSLRIMLLISNGALCILDLSDAAIHSGGCKNLVEFFMRLNILAWLRLTILVLKEICIRTNVERDILAMREINASIEAYLSDLRDVNLEAFEREAKIYHDFGLVLQNAKSENDINAVLEDFYISNDMSKPWSGSFDAFMGERSNQLRFS